MPKRLVRDGLLSSKPISELSAEEERFFVHLMLAADDFGRYEADLTLLRTHLFPRKVDEVKEADVERWLAATVEKGLVRLYSVDDKPYLEIQKFGQRARTAKYPAPLPIEESCSNAPQSAAFCGKVRQSAAKCGLGVGEGVGEDEDVGEGEKANKLPKALPYPRSIEEIAQLMKSTASCGLRGEELEKCATRFFDTMEECGWRLRNGLPIADWRASARKYALSWQANIANRPIGAGKGAGRPAPRISNAGCNDPADYAQSGSKLSHDNNDPNAPF